MPASVGRRSVIIGGWVLARRAREQKYRAHEQLGAALGFTPLRPRATTTRDDDRKPGTHASMALMTVGAALLTRR
ncbi:MAG: hypothetical protein ABTQ32_01325 [Myxococcaceae bacterium]